jgi:hypothetical protein
MLALARSHTVVVDLDKLAAVRTPKAAAGMRDVEHFM